MLLVVLELVLCEQICILPVRLTEVELLHDIEPPYRELVLCE